MSKTRRVTLSEFILLVQNAQKTHSKLKEPIPLLKQSQYGLVESCLKTPFQTFGGKDLYRGFLTKAAILFYLINKNHCLSNGNKRMACLTLGYLCEINNKKLTIPPHKFSALAKKVTMSNSSLKDETIENIKAKLKPYIK
jgi:death on curing protein